MIEVDQELDLSDLNCPMPILRTKVAFASMAQGEIIIITVNNFDSVREINAFCRQMGHKVLQSHEADGSHHFWLEKV